MDKQKYRITFFVLIISLVSGCDYYGSYRVVTLFPPEPPETWGKRFPSLEFRLIYPDYSDPEGFTTVRLKSGCGPVSLKIPKAAYVPCLLQPVPPVGTLRPAGVIITEKDHEPTWEDGFLASLLLRMYYRRDVYPAVNIERLREEIKSETVETVWSLDSEPIILGLSFGSLRADTIRELAKKSVELKLSRGLWFWDDPMKAPVIVSGPEETVSLELYPGRHCLFHSDTEECISIHVGEKEWFALFYFKESYISGSL